MSKQTPTKDVFDRLADPDDPDTVQPTSAKTTAVQCESDEETVAVEPEIDVAGVPTGDADAPITQDAAGAGAPAGDRRVRRRVVAVLVGVVLVAALGLSAFLGWRLIQVDQTAAAGRAALEAAKKYAVTLTTLDAKDIDKNYSEAVAGATGQFRDEYSAGAAQLRQILIDNKATGKGVVLDAAIKSATKTRVEVLLFVDQSVENAVLSAPRIDRNRVQMTMELVDNHWLAGKVEII
ncbi:hypothetical protein [Mycobacterium talmoniae]|uniref:hypothetical protein n=1 Tax=Mycobacterium talmoniae TaxID=1858794 RepID=UPI0009F542F4|nr:MULTISPECIES: hypothetical protein [Mycobacterium]TDH56156.1 Mce protein [Mycobacterium eburneum]